MPSSSDLRRRGWAAVGLLLGFYALSLLILALCVGAIVIPLLNGVTSPLLIGASAGIGIGVLRALVVLDRRGRDLERQGAVAMSRADQPALWALVDGVAAAVSSPPPTRVLLTADANAAVLQSGSFMGLRPGKRIMLLGLPLLATMSEDQLRGVLAHEFGHYLGGDTQVGALLYRGASGLQRVILTTGSSVVRELFEDYYAFFLRVSRPVSRAQELNADDVASSYVGPVPLRDGLASAPGIEAVWHKHVEDVIEPAWTLGLSVADPFTPLTGLAARQPGLRQAALESALAVAPDRFDSHPPLRERLERLGGVPTEPLQTPGCLHLLADLAGLESRLRRNFTPPAARAFARVDIAYADVGEKLGEPIALVRARRLLDAIAGLPTTGVRASLGHLLEVLAAASEQQRANLARNTVGKGALDPDAVLLADVRSTLGLALVQQDKAVCELATTGPFPYAFRTTGRGKLEVDALASRTLSGEAGAVAAVLKRARVDLDWRPVTPRGTDVQELAKALAQS